MTSTASNEIPPGVSLNHPHGSMQASIDKLRELTIASAENGESDDLGVVIIEDGNESEALVRTSLSHFPLFTRKPESQVTPREQIEYLHPNLYRHSDLCLEKAILTPNSA